MNFTTLYHKIQDNKAYICEPVYSELLAMVNEELAKEAEKAAGRKANIRAAVKQFLDNPKTMRLPLLHGHRFTYNGKDYIGYLDGYKMAWSSVDFGFGINGENECKDLMPIQCASIIDYKFKNKVTIPIDGEFRQALALHIKKFKKSEVYTRTGKLLGQGCFIIKVITENNEQIVYSFNPYFLKPCLDFTDATEMILDGATNHAPVFFFGADDRNALCLPVREDPDAELEATVTIDTRKAA